MKERLIELISKVQYMGGLEEKLADYLLANGVVVVDTNKVSAKNLPLITHIAGYPINEVIDLMEAKNAGRIVELPCAVGDTVYFPWEYDGQSGIAHNEVESIKIYCNNFPIIVVEDWESDMPMPISFSVQDFGKTVFLTKELAEKALERSEVNNG